VGLWEKNAGDKLIGLPIPEKGGKMGGRENQLGISKSHTRRGHVCWGAATGAVSTLHEEGGGSRHIETRHLTFITGCTLGI